MNKRPPRPFLFDAHLDLSMNAMEWNRDLRCDLDEIRRRETSMNDKKDRAKGVVSFPSMRRGNIGLCVATQIARYVKPGNFRSGWFSPEQAYAQTQAQLSWYRAMEKDRQLKQITNRKQLHHHLQQWMPTNRPHLQSAPGKEKSNPALPIGYILSLEGADSIVNLDYLTEAYASGLRAIGLAHYGPGTYAAGTNAKGGLTARGRDLLHEMDQIGIILDVTHLTDKGFQESLERFNGPVWASHSNCRAITPHQRQLNDQQIRLLIQRSAVIGIALDARMLIPDWIQGKSTPQQHSLTLKTVVNHVDHICQIAGNAEHVGIGSDLDGGFGTEQCPADLDSIEKLQTLAPLLRRHGYSNFDTENILSQNWIRFLNRALPA